MAIDNLGQTASATLTLTGAASAGLPSGQFSDVTALGQVSYSGSTFNRHTQVLYALATLTNISAGPLTGPVEAVLNPFSPSAVGLVNPDGQTSDGRPFVSFLTASGSQELMPGASSSPHLVTFANSPLTTNHPALTTRFAFGLTLLAPGNTAPVFSSVHGLIRFGRPPDQHHRRLRTRDKVRL